MSMGGSVKVRIVGRRIMTFNAVLLLDDKKLATEVVCFTLYIGLASNQRIGI